MRSENWCSNSLLKIWEYYAPLKNVNHFNPYIAGITSIFLLLEERKPYQDISTFISWYFDKINKTDRYGLSGTIYDYLIYCDGKEVSLDYYDSADGYAGIFLTLNYVYFLKTKDSIFLRKQGKKLELIGYLIANLINNKGLTISSPANRTSYLMNNLEAYGGLVSLYKILEYLGQDEYSYYKTHALNLKRSILSNFYDKENGLFFWAVEEKKAHKTDIKITYPDLLAQIFPIMYGLTQQKVMRNRLIEIINAKLNPVMLPKEQYFLYRIMYKMENIFKSIS